MSLLVYLWGSHSWVTFIYQVPPQWNSPEQLLTKFPWSLLCSNNIWYVVILCIVDNVVYMVQSTIQPDMEYADCVVSNMVLLLKLLN